MSRSHTLYAESHNRCRDVVVWSAEEMESAKDRENARLYFRRQGCSRCPDVNNRQRGWHGQNLQALQTACADRCPTGCTRHVVHHRWCARPKSRLSGAAAQSPHGPTSPNCSFRPHWLPRRLPGSSVLRVGKAKAPFPAELRRQARSRCSPLVCVRSCPLEATGGRVSKSCRATR